MMSWNWLSNTNFHARSSAPAWPRRRRVPRQVRARRPEADALRADEVDEHREQHAREPRQQLGQQEELLDVRVAREVRRAQPQRR